MSMVQASDVVPVRSRVSWGAILAGGFVALAMFLLLGVLGGALGLTIDRNTQVTEGSQAIMGGIWYALTLLLSLFLGGFVASRCTVGENKTEAMLYGVLVWGVVLSLSALFTTTVASAGLGAAMTISEGTRPGATNNPLVVRWTEEDLRGAGVTGVTQEQINKVNTRQNEALARGREALQNPETRTAIAWWTFAAMALSLGAAVGGSLFGAGPELILTSIRIRRSVTTTDGVREPVSH